MPSFKWKIVLVGFCLFLLCIAINAKKTYSYYGGLFDYGLNGLYDGLYGSLYAPYGGLYGLSSSLYGFYGGLYGSLYAPYGGLYGLSNSLYGFYGGLYGSLYGLYGGSYGLYGGLGGLYSLSSGLYGIGRLGFGGEIEQLTRQAQVPLTNTIVIPTLPDPTGSWGGTWLSSITLRSGVADFELLYSQGILLINGTAALYQNSLVPITISVTGVNSATGFTLSGTYFDLQQLTTYYVDFKCTLSSTTFITGSYSIHDALYLRSDIGIVGASLNNPVPIIVPIV